MPLFRARNRDRQADLSDLLPSVQAGGEALDTAREELPARVAPDLEITTPNALGGLGNLLTQPTEEVKDERIKIKSPWRIERRGRKNTTGYAIYKRGVPPQYLGYVGEFSNPADKPDWFPAYKDIKRS